MGTRQTAQDRQFFQPPLLATLLLAVLLIAAGSEGFSQAPSATGNCLTNADHTPEVHRWDGSDWQQLGELMASRGASYLRYKTHYYEARSYTTDKGETVSYFRRVEKQEIDTTQTEKNTWSYPNPADHYVTIQLSCLPDKPQTSLVIHDQLGRVVKRRENIQSTTIPINTADLDKGAYYYKVKVNRQSVGNGKIILR